MIASKFGPWLYLSDAFISNAVFRVDLNDGTLTTVISRAQSLRTPGEINTVRGLAELPDGSLLIMNRSNGTVNRYKANGTYVETCFSLNKMGGVLQLSHTGKDLYYTQNRDIFSIDLETRKTKYVANASAVVMGLLEKQNDLYFSPLHNGVLGTIDLTSENPSKTVRQAASGMGAGMRLIHINTRNLRGTLLLIK